MGIAKMKKVIIWLILIALVDGANVTEYTESYRWQLFFSSIVIFLCVMYLCYRFCNNFCCKKIETGDVLVDVIAPTDQNRITVSQPPNYSCATWSSPFQRPIRVHTENYSNSLVA